ncbi:MAG: tetratricopeptide repeat protein, partial [Bacteroidota bacterium]
GREHSHVAACYSGLAEILTERGEYLFGRNYAEQALSIYEKTNGPDNVEIGKVMLVLAEINKGQLQYEAAESLGTRALDIFEKTAGPDSLPTGKALLLLASLNIAKGNYTEASAFLQRADTLYIKTYKKKKLDTGKLLYYQGEILRLQGDPKKAQGLYKKALKYFKKRSKFHPDLGKTLIALAACRKSDLKYIKAEELQREGLAVLESSLGAESIILEEPTGEMAGLLAFNRNHQQAGSIAYQLFKIREQKYGAQDLRTAAALNQLSKANLNSNRLSEAEFFSKQAQDIAVRNGDSGNREKIVALLLRAKILIRQGDYPNAQSHWEEASALTGKLSGKEPLLTVELLETESLLNSARGNYIAAESVLQKAITEAEAAYGEFHSGLAELLKQLSDLYEKQGRLKEAEAVEKRIKKIYSKIW